MKQYVAAAVCLVALVGCRRTPQEQADYDRKAKELSAQVDAEKAAEKAVHDLMEGNLRKACGSKTIALPSDTDVVVECEATAKSLALNPSSVDFPGMFDHKSGVAVKGCALEHTSWMEAKNAYGATVRSNFRCSFDPRKKTASVKML